jgi:hypothetical protein
MARCWSCNQFGPAKPTAPSILLTVPSALKAYCQISATATTLVTTGAKKTVRNTVRSRRMPEFRATARANPMPMVGGTPTTTKTAVLRMSRRKVWSWNSRT